MSKAAYSSDRRSKERRVNVNRQFVPYGKFVRECIVNLSRRGAFILSNSELPKPGSSMKLSHTIVSDRIETIEGIARVVRHSEAPRGVGVVFERLTPESLETIEGLLDPRTLRPVGGSNLDLSNLRRHAFNA